MLCTRSRLCVLADVSRMLLNDVTTCRAHYKKGEGRRGRLIRFFTVETLKRERNAPAVSIQKLTMDSYLVRLVLKLKNVKSIEQLTEDEVRLLGTEAIRSLRPDLVRSDHGLAAKETHHATSQPFRGIPRQKTSVIWEVFTSVSPNYAECKLCSRQSRASQLWRHMYNNHRNVHDVLREKQKVAVGISLNADVSPVAPTDLETEKETTEPRCTVIHLSEGDLAAGDVVIVITGNQDE
jgi:hypothetical protein